MNCRPYFLLAPLIFFVTFSIVSQPTQAKTLEKIYAVVNGEIITLTEINEYRLKLKNGGFVNDLLFGDPSDREKAIKNRDFLISKLVDEKIMDYEVKKNGFVVNDEKVTQEMTSIAKSRGATLREMKQVLKSQNVNLDEYKTFIQKSIERRQLLEKEITSKIKISEQDVSSFQATQKPESQSTVFAYELAHILFDSNDRTQAKTVKQALAGGQKFEDLVKAHTIDEDGKDSGGAFGTFRSGEMLSSVEKAIQPLAAGQSSGIVETPMGLHIFKVTKKTSVGNPALQKERPQIRQLLFAKALQEQLDFWLSQKRKDAIVQINKS